MGRKFKTATKSAASRILTNKALTWDAVLSSTNSIE